MVIFFLNDFHPSGEPKAFISNVLGRYYDQAGFHYWLGLLETGQLNRGGVVRWIAANNEFIDKHPYLPY